MKTITEPNPTELHATIKLGIDAHAKWFYVARQLDGATPQPVQKLTFDGLLRFVAKQQRLAREVFTCYEAGAFGYHLHRSKELVFRPLRHLPAEAPGSVGGSAQGAAAGEGPHAPGGGRNSTP